MLANQDDAPSSVTNAKGRFTGAEHKDGWIHAIQQLFLYEGLSTTIAHRHPTKQFI